MIFLALAAATALLPQVQADVGFVNQHLSAWLATPSRACSDADISGARKMAEIVSNGTARQASVLQNNRVSDVQKYLILQDLRVAGPLAADALTRVGEAYTKGGCKTEAKEVFHEVLESYTGPAYESHRQRAIVGLQEAN